MVNNNIYIPPTYTIADTETRNRTASLHDVPYSFMAEPAAFGLCMDIGKADPRMCGLDQDFGGAENPLT